MPQHHRRGENHGRWVGAVGAHDILRDVPAARLEEREFLYDILAECLGLGGITYASDVASWDDTRSTDKGGTNVGHDSAVQVRHDHDIELGRAGNELHGAASRSMSAKRAQSHCEAD